MTSYGRLYTQTEMKAQSTMETERNLDGGRGIRALPGISQMLKLQYPPLSVQFRGWTDFSQGPTSESLTRSLGRGGGIRESPLWTVSMLISHSCQNVLQMRESEKLRSYSLFHIPISLVNLNDCSKSRKGLCYKILENEQGGGGWDTLIQVLIA